jgi:hypothetical protein
MVFLLILYLIFFTFLAWQRISWAVALLIALLPSYLIRFSFLGIPLTLLEVMILVLFVVWLIKNLRLIKNYQWLTTEYFLPFSLFLLIATISILVSPNLRAALGIWKAYFIEPILFFVVFTNVFGRSRRDRLSITQAHKNLSNSNRSQKNLRGLKNLNLITYALGFSALYISLFAIYQKFTGFAIPEAWYPEESRRVTSFFGYPNALGLYLAPIAVLYLGISKLKIKLFSLLVILLSVVAIIFAHSEGALAGILAGVFFFLFFSWNKKRTIIILLIFIILAFTLPLTRNYILPIITFQDESGPIRLAMWKETLQMLKDRPLLGAGLAGYQTRVAPYHQAPHIEIYLYPHNIFMNFWSELGLAGLIIFLWIVVKFYKIGFRKKLTSNNRLAVSLMAAMSCILIHGLVDVPYFKNDLSVIFWLLIGMMVILEDESQNN